MTNPELRDLVATKLNAAIDLPLIGEEYEQFFFQTMVEQLWRYIPKLARDAISSGTALVDAGDLAHVTAAIQSALLPRVSDLLWWRKDKAEISNKIAATLLDIATTPAPVETPATDQSSTETV